MLAKYTKIDYNIVGKKEPKTMFETGDIIVYPMYGAGTIIGIEKKEFLGEIMDFYCVSLPYCRMEASVPVNNSEKLGVRYVCDSAKVEEVKKVLGAESESMNPNWNKRYRANIERMQTGDILEVAAVVRNLVRIDREKPLSTGEKRLLNQAKQILISELIYAMDVTAEEVDKMVESHI